MLLPPSKYLALMKGLRVSSTAVLHICRGSLLRKLLLPLLQPDPRQCGLQPRHRRRIPAESLKHGVHVATQPDGAGRLAAPRVEERRDRGEVGLDRAEEDADGRRADALDLPQPGRECRARLVPALVAGEDLGGVVICVAGKMSECVS